MDLILHWCYEHGQALFNGLITIATLQIPGDRIRAKDNQQMKSLVFLFALCTSTAFAQPEHRVSLQLGSATVWLGMDRVAAKQTIEASGMIFNSHDSDGQVTAVDVLAKRLFTLEFEKNKLVYADRNWLHESDGLPSVMDALTSLIDRGATTCEISHAPLSSPDTKMNRIFVDCGDRGMLLSYGSVNGMTNNTVAERIGHFR
ncbi:hypothetical protein [Edaphobacter modestus]|uniref:Uncharacterized protein n=1 Tax=Edaphobacter modestus TaxID=388466 RepID=A0A4Q7YPI6_9BACT|nr:hypothetical protein [Edaphobacter modestus]RZU39308.1 hypothetical protein BDD14_0677 [Edaphobacter modestus]